MAYASDESGGWQVYVQTFPVPGRKRVVSVNAARSRGGGTTGGNCSTSRPTTR